jgi:hypothetical protein
MTGRGSRQLLPLLPKCLSGRSDGRSQGRLQPASGASESCVPSMFDSWRGESPRTNLMEVKDSEAQGLPSRDGV